MKAVAIVFGCVLVLGGAGAGWLYWHLDHNIRSVDIDSALGDDRPARPVAAASPSASPPSEPVDKGVLNLLVLGSDSRSGKENKALGGGDSGGARSDTAMVVHLDAGRTGATVVSIPRDTLVERPSCPTESGGTTAVAYNVMFNSAYALGGPVCAVKTVEQLTGVRMDHYLEVDFAGFAKLVDALGGVDVTTAEDIDDDLSHLHLKAGEHHLDGEGALAFARTRHGVGDGSDLGRIKLQQQLVKALMGKVSADGLLTDPARLYKVADAATGSLVADTGLDSLSELTGLARSVDELPADAVKTVVMPVVQAPSDANRVVADEPEAGKLWESLR
ncbi:LCP family protein [Streptomyces kunmingensis]|uniref:LCP family protein n=1 Tax=Streptomyces kunmingensis TaxID=68225 RepID=A0ABU6CEL4_9ACTN|nr:LCP family protein [Streptomyces kunmingensis]MEB3962631.1 LCP family protein [Streptomyces kunmingensis]